MVFINKLADHSHHDDLRVDDELVVQKLKLPTNATVEGLNVSHIQGLSDSLGNLTIDESALLADVNTQIAGKADASSVYTQTELDTIHATFAPASTTYTKTQVDAGLTAKLDATTYNTGIALKADITALNATNTTLATKADASATTASLEKNGTWREDGRRETEEKKRGRTSVRRKREFAGESDERVRTGEERERGVAFEAERGEEEK